MMNKFDDLYQEKLFCYECKCEFNWMCRLWSLKLGICWLGWIGSG